VQDKNVGNISLKHFALYTLTRELLKSMTFSAKIFLDHALLITVHKIATNVHMSAVSRAKTPSKEHSNLQ